VIRWFFRILALVLAVYGIGFGLFAMTLAKPAGDERTDAIIVLTGGTGRLERGFDLMQRHLADRMLISGVERTVRPQELAAHYGVDPALFDCCIVLGREAVDTRTNADEVGAWLARRRIHSIRLVTNDVHMRRARHEIGRRLPADVTVVEDGVPSHPDMWQIFREYNKMLLGWAAGLVGL
jgi:uncharacterized SAM-binding protein YcdF (DUF218 family)